MAVWTFRDGKDALRRMFGDLGKFFGVKTKTTARSESRLEFQGAEHTVVPKKVMKAVRAAYRRMEPLRKRGNEAVKQFIGRIPGYEYSAGKEVPVNKLYQMIRIYMRLLAPVDPQVTVTTRYNELKPFAETLRIKLNNHLREIRMNETLYRAVLSALFGWGVVKTGLAEGVRKTEIGEEEIDIGEAFTDNVAMRNFVIDMDAENMGMINFIGDRFKRPVTWAKQFIEKEGEGDNPVRSDSEEGRGSNALKYEGEDEDDLYKEAWFWNIYLPKDNVVLLFQDGNDNPLMVWDWEGPEGGPYQVLVFDYAPDEVLPVSPSQNLLPVHNFINGLLRKLERQANRQKTLTVGNRAMEEDITTIRDASDGDVVGLTDGEPPQEIRFGGPDPQNHNMAIWGIQQFDEHAGGLGVLGGTEPMSETYKQDQLLHDSANVLINSMRRRVMDFVNKIIAAHAWYVWTEPIRDIEVVKTVPGTSIVVPVKYAPDVRDGDFLQYNFEIDPYSMQNVTPSERAQQIIQLWMNVIMPSAGIIQQAGYVPNALSVMKQICELQNIPFNDMFIPVDLSAADKAAAPGKEPLPPQAAGAYRRESVQTRISRPGTTKAGNVNKIVSTNMAMAQAQGA